MQIVSPPCGLCLDRPGKVGRRRRVERRAFFFVAASTNTLACLILRLFFIRRGWLGPLKQRDDALAPVGADADDRAASGTHRE